MRAHPAARPRGLEPPDRALDVSPAPISCFGPHDEMADNDIIADSSHAIGLWDFVPSGCLHP